VRIRFLTSTPLDVRRGSGTFVGISVLSRALEAQGHTVAFETPHVPLPVYTAQRYLFNRGLRAGGGFDLTVGFDLDGYRIAAEPGHVAALKGVIADEVRFELGMTRLTMGLQAQWEREHVTRASRVLATSDYSAEQARAFYGLACLPRVVPEPIDLAQWRSVLAENRAGGERFSVLFVGRHYRRKRVDVLLRAAAMLRERLRDFEVRIAGAGPCTPALRRLSHRLGLDSTVTWLGDVTRAQLAAEYNCAAVFCLPSVQEGFGIVLLEAMAARKPIVASRAAAIPEVVPGALLVEPDSAEALAAALERLHGSSELRARLISAGDRQVEKFDAPLVARAFLAAASGTGAAKA
jgi:glycosyltransferase involved in cell wall biosynthesis